MSLFLFRRLSETHLTASRSPEDRWGRTLPRLRGVGRAPSPGTRIVAGDDTAGEVVRAAADGDAAELLAVISLARLGEPLRLEDGPPLERLALPYDVGAAS